MAAGGTIEVHGKQSEKLKITPECGWFNNNLTPRVTCVAIETTGDDEFIMHIFLYDLEQPALI